MSTEARAMVVFACRELATNQTFFESLGFRLDVVFPADAPRRLEMSGHGLRLCLEAASTDSGGQLRIDGATDETHTAPNGVVVQRLAPTAAGRWQPASTSFAVHKHAAAAAWHTGRAGMLYRDLVPDRFGGSAIASHIRIPVGGPVPDAVHFHHVHAQVIYCHAGWVRLVYENQGAPFVLRAGDCVLQPPQIRHRVLECSDGLEVFEVAAPAEHHTCLDREMSLPDDRVDAERLFSGQRFWLHRGAEGTWQAAGDGWLQHTTGIGTASGGVVDVRRLRISASSSPRALAPNAVAGLRLLLVLRGTMTVNGHAVEAADAIVLPEHTPMPIAGAENAELLEITLRA